MLSLNALEVFVAGEQKTGRPLAPPPLPICSVSIFSVALTIPHALASARTVTFSRRPSA